MTETEKAAEAHVKEAVEVHNAKPEAARRSFLAGAAWQRGQLKGLLKKALALVEQPNGERYFKTVGEIDAYFRNGKGKNE